MTASGTWFIVEGFESEYLDVPVEGCAGVPGNCERVPVEAITGGAVDGFPEVNAGAPKRPPSVPVRVTEDAKLTDFLEDGRVESGSEDAESSGESIESPDESAVSPDESAESPDEATASSDESAESPDESTASPDESTVSPDKSTGKSDEAAGTAPGTVEPAVTTYGWGTYRCSRCEVVTDCVWRSTEEFVCPDCKQW